MTGRWSPQRVRPAHVAWVAERLNDRDRAILHTLQTLHVARGLDLERLHFADLEGRSRSVVRWRVLKRLVDWRVIHPLPRRVGGSLAGSAQLAFVLDSAGARLVGDTRRPPPIAARAVAHRLGVTELYVALSEQARRGVVCLDEFVVEPACWVPDGRGGLLKPDAFARLSRGSTTDNWWIEYDRATETVPVLRGKLRAYLDYLTHGHADPTLVMPWVLFDVPDADRVRALKTLIRREGNPHNLFHVVTHSQVITYVLKQIAETDNE